MKLRGLLSRLTLRPVFRWVIRHPWMTLVLLALLTAAFALFIPRLQIDVDFVNYLNKDDPAVIAGDRAKDRFGSQVMLMVSVLRTGEGGIFVPETLDLIETLERRLDDLTVVQEVTGPLSYQVIRGSESSIQIGPAAPKGEAPGTQEGIDSLRKVLLGNDLARGYVISASGEAASIYLRAKNGVEMIPFAEAVDSVVSSVEAGDAEISTAGVPYLNLTLGKSMSRDLVIFLPGVLLVIVAVLYASFRWTWGVVIPLAVVAATVLWTVGLMGLFNIPITVISFILPVLLMAIGIADGIHVLSRYREELARPSTKQDAILKTMVAMERPVVMTSLTTAAGFLSLLNSYMLPQRTFGVFTAVGIVVAMLLSLVLIPALLQLLPVPPALRGGSSHALLSRFLGAFERRIVRARWVVLALAVVIAVVLGGFLAEVRIETSQRAYLGENHPAVRSLDLMDKYFSGGEQIVIEVDTGVRDGMKDPALLNALVDLEAYLKSQGIQRVVSLADMVEEMHQRFEADDPAFHTIPDDRRLVSQLLLLFTFQGGDLGALALGDFSAGELIAFHAAKTGAEQVALVRDITTYLDEHFAAFGTAEMVGATRIQASMFTSIARSQITSLVTSIAAAAVIVVLLMGSIVYGLLSLVPLLFTIVVNFGIMALSGTPLDIATLMVASITIGIGIDYGIHFIVRFREAAQDGSSSAAAVEIAGRSAGRGILYNALALALGFSVLLFSAFRGMRSFGGLISMTMIISAISALTVIPAILAVLPRRRDATNGGKTSK